MENNLVYNACVNERGGIKKMEKKNFISVILGVIGLILFGLGMCMCMLPEWNAFQQGIVVSVVGLVFLLVMVFVRRKMEGKPMIQLNIKTVGIVIFGIIAVLILGVGMCMTMIWSQLMVQGIIVGVVGIALLLCLIPMCKGFKS